MVKIGNIKASNIPCKIFVLDICERHCVNTGAIKTQTSHLTPHTSHPENSDPKNSDPKPWTPKTFGVHLILSVTVHC